MSERLCRANGLRQVYGTVTLFRQRQQLQPVASVGLLGSWDLTPFKRVTDFFATQVVAINANFCDTGAFSRAEAA